MVGFTMKLLLLAAISPSLDARKLLRSRDLGGAERLLQQDNTDDSNIDDDTTQLELFNKEFFEITYAYASEETGEKTIIIEREDVIPDPTAIASTNSPTLVPTLVPTVTPTTLKPTNSPTSVPTVTPTTLKPTTLKPSVSPTSKPTQKPSLSPSASPVSSEPTASPHAQLTQSSFNSKNRPKSNKRVTDAPSPSPSDFSYNDVPMSFEGLTSVDLPPISITINAKYTVGEIDTDELSSLFSEYLMQHLQLELPAKYEVRDMSLDTNYFMQNGTEHECFVTGQLDVVESDRVDFTELNQVISLILLSLFSENDFLEVVQGADDKILHSTTEVKLALLKGIERQSSINALMQEEVPKERSTEDMYFIIACAGFGAAVLLLGFSVHYSSKRKAARKSRGRGGARTRHRSRRDYSPDNRSYDSYDANDKCGVPVMDFVVEACSSFLTNDSGDRSRDSVDTRALQNNSCSFGSFWETDDPKPKARSSSMPPQRRPYPYPATQTRNGRGHVRRSSQPSDMSLAMKSTGAASIREEWTCVDGVVTKKVRRQ